MSLPILLRGLAQEGSDVSQSLKELSFSTVISVTGSITYGAILTLATGTGTITVNGAVVGDAVVLGMAAAPIAGIVYQGYVSAANTVTVRAFNVTAGSITPGATTFNVIVIKP
jgi:hypothetical protein